MAVKQAVKKTPAKKAAKSLTKGQSYMCTACGLVVTVDEDCGCIDVCDIICCDQPMQPKAKAKAKAKPKAKAS